MGIKTIVVLLVSLVVVSVRLAEAQQPAKVSRIGFLFGTSRSAISARTEAFQQGLRELGYVEGKNIVIEWRSAEGKPDRLPSVSAELVRLKVDVIVTTGSSVTRAAKEATVTIPIVMMQDRIPLEPVSSLASHDPAGTSLDCQRFARK
jgi:putative ABC transport system substrate-binding protein